MRPLDVRACIGLLCLVGCASLQPTVEAPEVFLVGLAPIGGGVFEQRVRFDLRLQNPNDFDLKLSGIEFRFDVNGEALARGLSNQEVTVPRLGETVVSVDASTTLVGLLHQVVRLSERRELTYDLRGKVHLRGRSAEPIAFERRGELTPK